jgi:hypothetical protein
MIALLLSIASFADVTAPPPRPAWATRCSVFLEGARDELGRGGEIVFLPREPTLWWSRDTLELRIGEHYLLRIEHFADARPGAWWNHERDRLPR